MPSTLVGFFPGTSPFSPPRRGLQAQWLWRPGSPSEQRLPAYSQPSIEVDLTLTLVDFSPPQYAPRTSASSFGRRRSQTSANKSSFGRTQRQSSATTRSFGRRRRQTRGASSSVGDGTERPHPVNNNDVDVIADSRWLYHTTDRGGLRPPGRSFGGSHGGFPVVRRRPRPTPAVDARVHCVAR